MQFITIIYLILINALLGIILFFILKGNKFLWIIYAIIWSIIIYIFPNKMTFFYFGLPHVLISILAHLLSIPKNLYKQEGPFNMIIETTKGPKLIPDIDRGAQVFGSSGSGKTASVIASFIKHYKKWNFSGVLYDYKNGELTELLLGIYGRDGVKIIAPHNPYISDRCNFLDPNILTDEVKIAEIVKVILLNLSTDGKKTDFFMENAEALLVGTILKFKLHHPEMCTFPHVCAFLTTNEFGGYRAIKTIDSHTGEEKENIVYSDFKQLEDFLSEEPRVKIQAAAFLRGLASERQTASVMSTLLNALRKFSNPRFFWVFSASDFQLNINDKANRQVVSILNDPSISLTVTPFIAGTMQAILSEMSVRDQEPSFLALDEGATLKLLNMAQIPATMRSFKIATLYATQDITQGFTQYGVHEFKSILANLSVKFFGSANDPETAQFYEKYIEDIEKDRISENKDAGLFGGSLKSINISKQEIKKIRYTEFFTLGKGEFISVVGGDNDRIQFSYPNNPLCAIAKKSTVTDHDIDYNFYSIIKKVGKLTQTIK